MRFRNNHQNLLHVRLLLSCLIIFGLVAPNVLQGKSPFQDTQEKPVAAVQDEPTVEVIPAPDIVVQAQKVSADLNQIRTLLHPLPEVKQIETDLPPFVSSIEKAQEEFEAFKINNFTFRQLEQLRDRWLSFSLQAEAWQSTLANRSQDLENRKNNLSNMKDRWEKTRIAARGEEFSETLEERIGVILNEIDSVEQELRQRLEAAFTLQDQVSTQFSTITEILNQLDTAGEYTRRNLLVQDSPPLWKAFSETEEELPLSKQLEATWDQKVEAFGKFLSTNTYRLLVHLGLFILLALAFLALSRHGRDWLSLDESLKASLHILSHPFSVAFLLAVVAFANWIYPQIPQVVRELARLMLVIPLLRLLPGMVPQALRRPIYGLASLYIMQLLGEVLPSGALLERVVTLVLTVLALSGMLWLLKPDGVWAGLTQNRWIKAFTVYFRLSVLLFAGALISNILGNASLSEFLSWGAFLSIYLLVLIVMTVMVLDGLIFLFLKSRVAQSLRMVRLHTEMWNKGSLRFIRITAVIFWTYSTLRVFNLLGPVKNLISQILKSHLSVGSLAISLGDILAFVVTLVVSIYLAKIIRFVLNEDILPRLSLPRGVPAAISFVAYYFILLSGFFLALAAAGIEWSRFAILAGALGVGIGFGLQNLVNNFVSGLILIFERPIKVGDFIEFAGQRGEVLRIGIRSSTVRSWEGAEIIVPNGNLISSEVINWTLSDRRRRLKIDVGVAYGTKPDQVMEILKKVADEHPDVLDNPEPTPLFMGFGESSLDFEVRISIKEYLDWVRIRSEVYLAIHAALEEAEIEIPFPQHDLHLRSVDPSIKADLKKPTKSTAKPKT